MNTSSPTGPAQGTYAAFSRDEYSARIAAARIFYSIAVQPARCIGPIAQRSAPDRCRNARLISHRGGFSTPNIRDQEAALSIQSAFDLARTTHCRPAGEKAAIDNLASRHRDLVPTIGARA
jgi:hypothetical protein